MCWCKKIDKYHVCLVAFGSSAHCPTEGLTNTGWLERKLDNLCKTFPKLVKVDAHYALRMSVPQTSVKLIAENKINLCPVLEVVRFAECLSFSGQKIVLSDKISKFQ